MACGNGGTTEIPLGSVPEGSLACLWWPWPSYPAIYFFIAHGGIVIAVSVLVFGGVAHPGRRPPWRAFGLLLALAAGLGAFDAVAGANYMYLCRKPKNASLLDAFGPWPVYLAAGAALALALFWLLWIPLNRSCQRSAISDQLRPPRCFS